MKYVSQIRSMQRRLRQAYCWIQRVKIYKRALLFVSKVFDDLSAVSLIFLKNTHFIEEKVFDGYLINV